MASVGKNIASMRRMRKMTQEDVATRIGVTKMTIANYESGRRHPSYEQLEAIADVLNCAMADLIGNSSSKSAEDEEIDEYLEELRTRPEMRMLFSVAKGATAEDIKRAVSIIEALSKIPVDGQNN